MEGYRDSGGGGGGEAQGQHTRVEVHSTAGEDNVNGGNNTAVGDGGVGRNTGFDYFCVVKPEKSEGEVIFTLGNWIVIFLGVDLLFGDFFLT